MASPSPLYARQVEYQCTGRPAPQTAAHRPGAASGHRAEPPPLELIHYGRPEAIVVPKCELIAGFSDLESEYAAIRRGAGILDSPHRGVLVVSGSERRDFLDRMLTQKLTDLEPGTATAAFWLNRKGRIAADLLLVATGEQILVELDLHAARPTVESLGEFLFTEDVEITDGTEQHHVVAVHGPLSQDALAAVTGRPLTLEPGAAETVEIAGAPVVVARRDQTGEIGLVLFLPADRAEAVWDALIATDQTVGEAKRRVRPIGWHAFNIARIEAGTPLHMIDFGPESLPHETGLVSDRVSFAKGCYLGQEIVARIENLGKPGQRLVGLRMDEDRLPLAGSEVFPQDKADGTASCVGVVTSSTLSPMLGQTPIAFSMIKINSAEPGTRVVVGAEGAMAEAVVGGLRFHPPPKEPT